MPQRKIIISLRAKDEQVVRRALQGLGKDGEVALKRIDSASARAQRSIRGIGVQTRATRAAMAGLSRAVGVLAVALSVRELTRYADVWTTINNRIGLVTDTTAEAAEVQQKLFAVAQDSRASFAGLAELYTRVALASDELGISQERQIRFTEGVAKALAVTGTSSEQARGALLQLGQAIGGGTVRAEEFNSILENTPRIAQAVADGLDEAGGSVARLRQLVIDGEVSSQAFFAAFETQLPTLRAEFSETESTIGQAFTTLSNAFLKLIGQTDDATSVSGIFAGEIIRLADGFDLLTESASRFNDILAESAANSRTFFQDIEDFLRRNNLDFLLTDQPPSPIGSGLAGSPELGGRRRGQNVTPTETVSLADLPVAGTAAAPAARTVAASRSSVRRSAAAPDPFAFMQPPSETATEALEDFLEAQDRLRDKALQTLGDLRQAHLEANGEIEQIVNSRRDKELASLEELKLTEEEAAEARVLINEKAAAEIGNHHAEVARRQAEENERLTQRTVFAFANMAQTVGASFGRMARDGEASIGQITELLINLATQFALLQASGGGFNFGGLFGAASAGATAIGGVATVHTGGVMGVDATRRRNVSMASFMGAPRLHGGFMPNEFPAVLERGEGVFTPGQMRALGEGPKVEVVVNNNANVKVDTSESREGDRFKLMIEIDDITGRLARGEGSALNKAIRDVSGSRPRGVNR